MMPTFRMLSEHVFV